jgi:ribosome-binding protein aMBF1 (putative translation factor)
MTTPTQQMRERMAAEVRSAMAAQRITRTDLATKAKVSVTIIDSMRNATGNPGIDNVHKVYDALGLPRLEF